MLTIFGPDQIPTGVWYAPILVFSFVSPTITVGLWSRPQSSLARLNYNFGKSDDLKGGGNYIDATEIKN